MYEERFMQRAIEISRQALEVPGTQPFGAVVVRDGQIIGEGLNHAAAHFDPTSHSEIEAIRDACRNAAVLDLSDCELYTSAEPCPMCVATMNQTGLAAVYYAASAAQSAPILAQLTPAERRKIDSELVRAEIAKPIDQRRMPAQQALADDSLAVMTAWVEQVKARRGSAVTPAAPAPARGAGRKGCCRR